MDVGYARVSTSDQKLDSQLDALRKSGCGKVFTDTASGAKADRAGLSEALEFLRQGDTLVVWKLDRLGRSLKHLIDTINELHRRKIGFRSVQENVDTTTSAGKLPRLRGSGGIRTRNNPGTDTRWPIRCTGARAMWR